jgi:zinc protease
MEERFIRAAGYLFTWRREAGHTRVDMFREARVGGARYGVASVVSASDDRAAVYATALATRSASIALYYDVGSRAEPQGQTGFAHLFEHLMFEGTEALPKGEFDRLLSLFGADSNATTSEDRTNYYELLPAHALELGCGSRPTACAPRDHRRGLREPAAHGDGGASAVVREPPVRLSFLRRDEVFYDGYFPYAHSTIGDVRDLEMPGVAPAEQIARVRAFHTRFYAPDNAVLAMPATSTRPRRCAMVRMHFGPITRRRGEVFVRTRALQPPVGSA